MLSISSCNSFEKYGKCHICGKELLKQKLKNRKTIFEILDIPKYAEEECNNKIAKLEKSTIFLPID